MTGTADSHPAVSMDDVRARMANIMALMQQLTSESDDGSGRIAAERSGENAGGDVV